MIPLNLSPYVFNTCEQFCMMVMVMVTRGTSTTKSKYDLKATMNPIYGTLYRLRSISVNETQLNQYPSKYAINISRLNLLDKHGKL